MGHSVDGKPGLLWRVRRSRGRGKKGPIGSALVYAGVLVAPDQHDVFQARQMQTLSFVAHIPLVCFAIAFPAMVLFAEWRWLSTGDVVYLTLARRWSKILIALFAVGVVTGTILSFELGLLWPNFMSTFGGVFGLGFAIEGFSFFLEAIFIGIYAYSWNRLSPRTHFLTGIPIAIAGLTGSLMVIAVNGWMNHPSGFHLQDGKAVDVHPWHALFVNSYFWHELIHMYVAGYMVTGFLLAGAYAVARLGGRWTRYERTAFAIPLAVAALASPVQILVGDWAGRAVADSQPIKLAAFEGLGPTTKGAALHILGWYSEGDVKHAIRIPKLLSLLAYHDPNATVKGVDTVPADQRPPVNVVRVAFQVMVAIGMLLALLGAVYLWTRMRSKRLPESRWFYWAVLAAGPLSVVALIAGWVVTEVGRQPWVVYRLMRTSEAITRSGGIPVGYATLVLVYLGLALAVAWILLRLSRRPLEI
ncbi:MAG: cytochrome ubiquinol oxidase subunit I [Gaiellaceae bacterium]